MSAPRPIRRKEDADFLAIPFSHAALTANATLKLFKVPAGRELVVESVQYYNGTGLAADNTNAFRGEVLNGATVANLIFNTDGNDVPAGGALAAGYTDGVPSATAADTWFAETESVDVKFTLEGAQTLPAGNGTILARLY